MRILTRDEIRAVENRAFDGLFTEAQLMERAGLACADKMLALYGEQMKEQPVAVVCGNGKNAGDGFVIARRLRANDVPAYIVLADQAPTLPEPLAYYNAAVEDGVEVRSFSNEAVHAPFVVDCVFGIGFHGAPRSPFDTVFAAINDSGATVIAVDTPSGTDATTGAAEQAVRADLTIAISTLKYAHVLPPSNGLCGKTVVVNIGIPESCYREPYAHTVTKKEVQAALPKLNKNANKGSHGHLLQICGSYRMPGAAVIWCRWCAAHRRGTAKVCLSQVGVSVVGCPPDPADF